MAHHDAASLFARETDESKVGRAPVSLTRRGGEGNVMWSDALVDDLLLDRLVAATGEDDFGKALAATLHRITALDHLVVIWIDPEGRIHTMLNCGPLPATLIAVSATATAGRLGAGARVGASKSAVLWPGDGQVFSPPAFLDPKIVAALDLSDLVSFAVSRGHWNYEALLLRTGGVRFARQDINRLVEYADLVSSLVGKHLRYVQLAEKHYQVLIGKILSRSPHFARITAREREICLGILSGYTSEAIALNLSLSVNSVLTYRKRLYEKLGITSQNEIFLTFINAMIDLSDPGVDFGDADSSAVAHFFAQRLKARG